MPDLTLNVTFPFLMSLFRLRENLYLDEVLISFEEREFLEEPIPSDPACVTSAHQMLCDLHCLLYFSDHDVSSGQRDIMSRIHRWKGGCNYWEEVSLLGFVK